MEGNECLRHWTSYIHSLVFYLHIHNLYDSFLCTTFCVINNISLYRLSQIQLSYGRRSVWRNLIVFSAHSLQQQSVTAFSISCICPAGVSFCSICVCLIGPVNCEAQGNVQMFIRGLMCCVRVCVCVCGVWTHPMWRWQLWWWFSNEIRLDWRKSIMLSFGPEPEFPYNILLEIYKQKLNFQVLN